MRNYKRKRLPPKWTVDDAKAAVAAVREGLTIRQAVLKYGIPKTCLLRRLKEENLSAIQGPIQGPIKPVFTNEQEENLVSHIIDMQNRFYGLSGTEMRRIAYELAEQLNLKHTFNNDKKMAGKDWLSLFLIRHSEISIRKPEATSFSRITGFNRTEVSKFFDLLKSLIDTLNLPPKQIYNYDETGVSTVQKPRRIIAKKGQKQVGRIVSAERGSNITIACAFSASGLYVPPFFLFPRQRMQPHFMKGCSPGSIGLANGSGWMDTDTFGTYLDHFISYTMPSKEEPILLILDGPTSHKSLNAVIKARKNNITLLTLPPHCSHRLQPLDLTFFGPFKNQYAKEADYFMTNNAGKTISIGDVTELSCKAFAKVATVEKALKGFETCGISPFNADIFTDSDFLPASIVSHSSELLPSEKGTVQTREANANQSRQEGNRLKNVCSDDSDWNLPGTSNDPHPYQKQSVKENLFLSALTSVSPIPKCRQTTVSRKRRTVQSSAIITSSPFKRSLEEKEKRKRTVILNKEVKSKKLTSLVTPKDKQSFNESEKDCNCIYCRENFCTSKEGEEWIMCVLCGEWAHEACAGVEGVDETFVCDFCNRL